MTSIVKNLFSNFNDLTKSKSVTDGVSNYNTNNSQLLSQSLNQGSKFKKYQKKISNGLEKKAVRLSGIEGFDTQSTNESEGITEETNNLLKSTDMSTDNQTVSNLQTQYNDTLKEYNGLLAKLTGSTTGYINRTNPNNSYLNKYISWSDNGAIMYVTNQGVAKHITNWTAYEGMWGKNGCPTDKSLIKLDIPWNDSYLIEGTTIPTRPPLVVGTSISQAQSCSNEGNNVYVSNLVNNSTAKYNGCYADDSSSHTMTFLGGSPPLPTSIQNGNFSESVIANNSYKYLQWNTTTVPGWNFNCVLANNSSAWGYPMPYPNGNQCASIQKDQELWTNTWISFSPGVTYTISFYACGRNCCDNSGVANPIEIRVEGGDPFYTFTPPINKWTKYSANFTVDSTQSKRIWFRGTWTAGDRSSAIQGVELNSGSSSTTNGTYTYDMCKDESLNAGYKYFALQNVNTETSKGYCAVSNDSIAPTRNGTSYAVTKVVALWDSKTSEQTGNYAYLTDQGALTVYNTSGASVFNTDNSTAQPSDYLGCYGDTSKRAMPYYQGDMDYAACKKKATDNGSAPYFGLQNSSSGKNAQCFLASSITGVRDYGKAGNCTKISDGSWSGGGWSNAVYSLEPSSFYFLILQDDGNMVIYRGTGPNDNQGTIWSSETNGKQQKPDPKYAAAKGKYGKNWIASGSGLSPGDWVGSTDGSIYLVMQSDGNLILYTSQTGENCYKMKDGNTGGGVDANALYEFNETGIPANMGKVAYVDSNSLLYPYQDSSLGLSDDYTSYTNYSSSGNDISGTSFSNATIDSCKKACNDNKDCYGFDFDKTNKVCYPKNQNMYPKGSRANNSNVDLYVRKPKITKPPVGITDKILNVDSIAYENYPKGSGDMRTSYNLSNATSVERQQLDQLQSTMDSLSSQINDYSSKFETNNNDVEKQSNKNINELSKYVKNINYANNKVKGFNTNVDNILKDSDIVVLQKNYDYLFWSIIATATVLVSINIVKKN
jgi:hypothetical protein